MIDTKKLSELQDIADATAQSMYGRDQAAQGLGILIIQMKPGYAKVVMQVRQDMLNGHQTCHGGFIFALADTAFAYSCNSHNRNTVASGCVIDFLAPAFVGDVLTAEAQEMSRTGRTGVYDTLIKNQDEKSIALFRGRSYEIKGEVLQ